MQGPLLETKLHVPAPPPGSVRRSRLAERLDRGAASKLLLVSAPAGSGKTTVVADWLACSRTSGRVAAWLSLDAGDNDPATLWSYVIAALRTVAPGIGERALGLLDSRQPPAIEAVLATLINDLSSTEGDITLVLDDYHQVHAREVQDG